MSFGCYICNVFKRAFLYQVLIIVAVLKLLRAFRFNRDFYDRISTLIQSVGIKQDLMKYLPKNKELLYKGFLIYLIVIASFSILGVKFFQFFSGVSCILVGLLYFNPIIFYQKVKNEGVVLSKETLEQFLPDLEFCIILCLGLAMIANSCKPCVCEVKKVEEEKQEEVETKKEVKRENYRKVEDFSYETNKGKGKGKGKKKKKE